MSGATPHHEVDPTDGQDIAEEQGFVTYCPPLPRIERLELSPRTLNCLKRAHITHVGEVLEMSDEELLRIRNFDDKSLEELRYKLSERDKS